MAGEGTDPKRLWIERVLGYSFAEPGTGSGTDAAPDPELLELLAVQLKDAEDDLLGLQKAGNPLAEALMADLKTASAVAQDPGRSAEAQGLIDALQQAIAKARSGARVEEAGTGTRGIAEYRTMLMDWRNAQRSLSENIQKFSAAVKVNEEILEDPRRDDIFAVVDGLSDLIPDFGSRLEDMLDQAINEGPGEEADILQEEAASVISIYRQELAKYPQLQQLEQLAPEAGAGSLEFFSVMDRAMTKLEKTLKKAA